MKKAKTTFLSFRNKWHILLLICVFNSNAVYSQRTVHENDTTLVRANALTNVPCNPNTFWLIHQDQNNFSLCNIREYTLINNVISPTGYVLYGAPIGSLAYANDFTINGANSFYNLDTYSNNILVYRGGIWDTIAINLNGYIFSNQAGHGSNIVFQGKDTSINFNKIALYNGLNTSIIYTSDYFHSLMPYDLAIDINNNIWFFESNDSNFILPINLKSYTINNNNVTSYPLHSSSNFDGAYGMFILNNKIYVGVGNTNSLFPNCLIPFSIINDTVYQETPILLVAPAQRLDLESCNQGTLTSVSEVPVSLKELSVYPNPAENQFTVHLPYGSNRNAQLTIYNLQGKLIETKKASDTAPINCASWARGIYFVSLVEEGKAKVTRKIVVI